MARLPSVDADPGFGARDEDSDVCSDVEERAEEIRLAPEIRKRQQQRDRELEQRREHHKQLALRGIPEDLYDKAEDHQDQLTEEERQLLLSRGDVIGKALADFTSLADDEIHEILLWPPPDVARINVQRATGGKLNTPVELYAKAQDALDRGEFETAVNDEETALLARFFSGPDDTAFYLMTKLQTLKSPAHRPAYNLLCNLMGLHYSVRLTAEKRMARRSEALALQRLSPAARTETPKETAERARREYLEANPGRHQEHPTAETAQEAAQNQLQEYQRQLNAVEAAHKAVLFATRMRAGMLRDDTWMGTYQPVSKADLDGSGPWPESAQPRGSFRSSRTTWTLVTRAVNIAGKSSAKTKRPCTAPEPMRSVARPGSNLRRSVLREALGCRARFVASRGLSISVVIWERGWTFGRR